MSRRFRSSIGIVGLFLLPVLLGAGTASFSRIEPPPAVNRGNFQGSWVRMEPGNKQLLQIRKNEAGQYEIRLCWKTGQGLDIDTNWHKHTDFLYQELPGFLELEIDAARSTANKLIVTFKREQDGAGGRHLSETTEAVLYRTGSGYSLAWLQEPLVSLTTFKEPKSFFEADGVREESQRLWVFLKETNRIVPLDELTW